MVLGDGDHLRGGDPANDDLDRAIAPALDGLTPVAFSSPKVHSAMPTTNQAAETCALALDTQGGLGASRLRVDRRRQVKPLC